MEKFPEELDDEAERLQQELQHAPLRPLVFEQDPTIFYYPPGSEEAIEIEGDNEF